MKNSVAELKSKSHNPLIFNSVLWSCTFLVLLFIFSQKNQPKKIDIIYSCCFLFTLIIPTLVNLYVLIPLFLKKEKYLKFIISFIGLLFLFTLFNLWFFDNLIDYIFPDYYFISYATHTKLFIFFFIFLVTTTLIKLAEDWVYFNENENEKLKIENLQMQNQLSTLRSQINPHFLFNSLNVIYALALEKKSKATEAIIQLSDILRYVIYDSNTEFVPLKNEIQLLNNFIDFQKNRHNVSDKIKFDYEILEDDFLIYPMLLLPLLENSFKHGIMQEINNPFINLSLSLNEERFEFFIENNFNKDFVNTDIAHSGLGIENIKKNLKIVYPDKHIFEIKKSHGKFMVTLKLFR
jgi:sensor histidine kinase YesM